MVPQHKMKVMSITLFTFLVLAGGGVVLLGGGCESNEKTLRGGGNPSLGDPSPPVVQVTGSRAECNLGRIKAHSKHRVVFVIHNNSDTPLKLGRIRGDCPCIGYLEAPESIPPGQKGRVTAIFEAPDVNELYGSELIIQTDNPERNLIRLGVLANLYR